MALEGSCGAGKTEAAGWLAEIFDAGVVHMHDFFLPPHLRTGHRRGQPGGNIHYERFSIQVAPRLPWREPFSYQRFDCVRLTMAEWQQVRRCRWSLWRAPIRCIRPAGASTG